MSPEKIKAITLDLRRLVAACADQEILPLLPVTLETVRGLPFQLAPFQARWLFGNGNDELLAAMRALHPEIVAQQFGTGPGTRYRYSKLECCRASNAPCEELLTPKTGKRA